MTTTAEWLAEGERLARHAECGAWIVWLARRPSSDWQDIATAPRDRRILLAKIVGHPSRPTALWWACTGSWSQKYERWWDGIEPCGLAGPNYWMDLPPLPSPPEEPTNG